MRRFPSTLRLAVGQPARIDRTRLVAHFVTPADGSAAILNERIRKQLASLGLQVEGDPDSLRSINHAPSFLWLRRTRLQSAVPTTAVLGRAFGRRVDWIAPVYQLPGDKTRDAVFCARPDVLLLRGQPGVALPTKGLTEIRDKSRYLGGWQYFILREPNALMLRDQLIRATKGLEVELEYLPLPSPWLFIPDDPMFADQWGMDRINAPQAWDLTTGDRRVIVAVIDTGCDLDHPDLRGSYVSRGTDVGDPTRDGGPVPSVPGPGLQWHGTAVAGVIAAAIRNATGVAGLAAGCGILPVAVSGASTSAIAVAVRYAVDHGARVLNISMSIGSFWFEMFIRAAIDEAIAAGCVVCGSSGNGDGSPMVVPARYPPVMACGASQKDDARWRDLVYHWGTSFGDDLYDGAPSGISVVAPGVDIVTTDIAGPLGFTGRDYLTSSPEIPSPFFATSAATPHVAGAAALLMSLYPALSAAQVRAIIERTAEKTGGYAYSDVAGYGSGVRHPEMGYGRLNLFHALDFADVMIADWPGDDGIEPSTPPGGDFFSFSDVVIRPAGDDVFRPDDPAMSSLVSRGVDHTASVRLWNKGPAAARGVQIGLCATPYVGLEFHYPADWTADDALHVRPTPHDPAPFDLASGANRIVRFGFSAAQMDTVAGWSDMPWHPCLLASVTAANDYAFAAAPAGPSLQTRRNNLAQRNLSVVEARMLRSLRFPFAAGHPDNQDPNLELIIEAGPLTRFGEVYLVLADASRAFPAARRARAFVAGELKAGRVIGGKITKFDGQRAIRITASRATVELTKPRQGRFALQLAVDLPASARAGDRFLVRMHQRTRRGIVGGASVVFRMA